MKLVRILKQGQTGAAFGFLEAGRVYAFADLLSGGNGKYSALLASSEAYLSALPASYEAALAIREKAVDEDGEAVVNVKLLAPLGAPAALFDFGLSPRHLINSARTMFRHEFGSFIGSIASSFVARKIRKKAGEAVLAYYKSNHQVISGPYDDIIWPLYTSYLDIEPELAFVTGTKDQPLAGYCIFNDISARDVQFPEMIGSGPARSKDFSASNSIGPYLLTADELPDPLDLNVQAEIGNRLVWTGTTSEYSHEPTEVLDYLYSVFAPSPGTIIGMGTIPDCTGMDNNRWLLPGETVRIRFDALGELKQKVLPPAGKLLPSRWKRRPELDTFQ
ncbi:MAG: fumarylacetoacetate hydrolase family protein [Chitinispirillaceae bacterium]|nr:fumarylacetoacetate hydrolase family protein [Chitinispirillaceae bacterium]